MRTSGLLHRFLTALLAFLLASPLDLAQTGLELMETTVPISVAVGPDSVGNLRLKSQTSKRHRPSGALLPDQDDSQDGDNPFRPVQSAVQPSEPPRNLTCIVVPQGVLARDRPTHQNFTCLCPLRC